MLILLWHFILATQLKTAWQWNTSETKALVSWTMLYSLQYKMHSSFVTAWMAPNASFSIMIIPSSTYSSLTKANTFFFFCWQMTLASPMPRFLFVVTVISEWHCICTTSTRVQESVVPFTAKASSHVAYSTQNWNFFRVINSTF